jgi:hypothetical protein
MRFLGWFFFGVALFGVVGEAFSSPWTQGLSTVFVAFPAALLAFVMFRVASYRREGSPTAPSTRSGTGSRRGVMRGDGSRMHAAKSSRRTPGRLDAGPVGRSSS